MELSEIMNELGLKVNPPLRNTFGEPIQNEFDETISRTGKNIKSLKQHLEDKIKEYEQQIKKIEQLKIPLEVDIISTHFSIKKSSYKALLQYVEKYETKTTFSDLLNTLDNYKNTNIPTLPFLDILYQTLLIKQQLDYFYNSSFNNTTILKNNKNLQDDKYQKKIQELEANAKELEYYCGTVNRIDIPRKPKDTLVDLQQQLSRLLLKDISKFDIQKYSLIIIDKKYHITNLEKNYSKSRRLQMKSFFERLSK